MEYIHELRNLLNEHEVTSNVHIGAHQSKLSVGSSALSKSSNWFLSGSKICSTANSTLPPANDNFTFHHVQGSSDMPDPNFLLGLYLGEGHNSEIDNITSTVPIYDPNVTGGSFEDVCFRPISPAAPIDKINTGNLTDVTDDSTQNISVNESGNQGTQEVMMTPVCRVPPTHRMTPKSLVKVFNNTESTDVSSSQSSNVSADASQDSTTPGNTPQSPSHSVSSESSSVLSDEEFDKLFENNVNSDFYDTFLNSDFSAPSSPDTSFSGVSQFSSEEEELDFVMETACDMLPTEHFL